MMLVIFECECSCGCVWVERLGADDTPWSLGSACPDCGGDPVATVEVSRS